MKGQLRGLPGAEPPLGYGELQHPTQLHVALSAIAANWQQLAHTGPTAAVVKADAFGLGALEVAPALFKAGCRHFFVAHPQEAIPLRPLLPGAMLAVLNALWPGYEDVLVAHDLLPVLGSLEEILRWSAQARRLERRLPALLHIDTGINRLGLSMADTALLADQPERLQGIDLRYRPARRPGERATACPL